MLWSCEGVRVGSADLQPGQSKVVQADGKSIGIFNVAGDYYAMHNRCPHMAGNLCEGPVTGTSLASKVGEFVYGREGELVRCGWHGWEFEIKSGDCLIDPKMKAKTYAVTVDNGELVVHI